MIVKVKERIEYLKQLKIILTIAIITLPFGYVWFALAFIQIYQLLSTKNINAVPLLIGTSLVFLIIFFISKSVFQLNNDIYKPDLYVNKIIKNPKLKDPKDIVKSSQIENIDHEQYLVIVLTRGLFNLPLEILIPSSTISSINKFRIKEIEFMNNKNFIITTEDVSMPLSDEEARDVKFYLWTLGFYLSEKTRLSKDKRTITKE